MSLIDKILNELLNTLFPPKNAKVDIFNLPVFKNHSRGSVQSTFSRLRKKGFIDNGDKGWHLTPAGKRYMKKKFDSLRQFPNSFKKDASKNLIVMFDIPETKKSGAGMVSLAFEKIQLHYDPKKCLGRTRSPAGRFFELFKRN
jgi:hypothetical protein